MNRDKILRCTCMLLFFSLLAAGSMALFPVDARAASSGTFALTGSLNTARYGHAAVGLQNGEVLVAGGLGTDGSSQLASAELYSPSTGKWTVTGSMSEGRSEFIAVLLPNGNVLVAGGYANGTCLSAAELYNPSEGRWTATGSMVNARCLHSAALLPSGEVLVAGGTNASEPTLASAELYNPATGTWETTGSLHTSRELGAATLLANGEVLLAGGISYSNEGVETILTTAELYNPSSGVWSLTGSMAIGVVTPASALLANNDVLIANAVQFYSPGSGSWANTAPLPKTAEAANPLRATLLPNGNVLASGTDCSYSGCGHVPTTECFLYTTSSNTWSVTGPMNQARINHTSTLLSTGKVLVVGGESRELGTGITVLSSAELYTP